MVKRAPPSGEVATLNVPCMLSKICCEIESPSPKPFFSWCGRIQTDGARFQCRHRGHYHQLKGYLLFRGLQTDLNYALRLSL